MDTGERIGERIGEKIKATICYFVLPTKMDLYSLKQKWRDCGKDERSGQMRSRTVGYKRI